MKSGFFIMQMWQTGNVGSHNIQKLKANPEEGYNNYNEAKHAMHTLKKEANWELNDSQYTFTIMEVHS